jgi:glutamate/tyrosine decarboxylase-like PLP-dependent enzyme
MHVDGAYGLAAILSPRTRDLFNGIEHADSVITDPHKWWFAPFDCAALIYKDPRLAIGVHTQNASYLDVLHDDLPVDQFNPTDVAYHLTRRARGLAFWYSLVVNGTKAYEDAVTASIQLARETSDYIKTIDHLELVREPSLSLVLWRRRGWGLADYQSFQDRLLKEQIGFVTPSKWHGEVVGRFAFLHPHTTFDMVKEILELTR